MVSPQKSGLFPEHNIVFLLFFYDIKYQEYGIEKSNWIMDIINERMNIFIIGSGMNLTIGYFQVNRLKMRSLSIN